MHAYHSVSIRILSASWDCKGVGGPLSLGTRASEVAVGVAVWVMPGWGEGGKPGVRGDVVLYPESTNLTALSEAYT